MITVIFQTRLRADANAAELEELGTRMYGLASAMPGFVSYREYTSQDGDSLTLVEFESAETLATWRDHPEHREAQRRGREEFFAEYRVRVLDTVRDYRFPSEA